MYGLLLLPLVAVIALAVDFSSYILVQSQLNLAADAAAVHAVRVATQISIDQNASLATAIAAGQQAGRQWFAAQLGTIGTATIQANAVNVSVTYNPNPGGFAAQVSYNGTVATTVGSFIVPTWNIGTTASALATNSFLQITMMLDNSSSMQIGATYHDIELMMRLTPCSMVDTTSYSEYECTSAGNTYNGTLLACPLGVGSPPLPLPFTNIAMTPLPTYGTGSGPSCAPISQQAAHAPCAFACHNDTNPAKTAGSGNDLYALARSTIGTPNPITLRFDVLKTATQQLLATMQNAAAAANNLSVGIYTFNSTLTQVYPTQGEAGKDFAAAINAVGGPPTVMNGPDTGIQPELLTGGTTHSDTEFSATMDSLVTIVTPAGNGSTASTPVKVLFLVTDGYQNSVTLGRNGFDVSKCAMFKSMGYTMYVIYTPYYPLMDYYWLNGNGYPQGAPVWSGTVSANLQTCASQPSYYTEASDGPTLMAALQTFLTSAENAAARVTH
jgi:Flp pilus assembly protein TadG